MLSARRGDAAMTEKAESRKQKAEAAGRLAVPVSAICLLPSALLILLLTTGCGETSSPAASPPMMMTANSPDGTSSVPPNSPRDESKKPARDVTFDTIKFDMQKDEPFKRAMITP